MMDIGHLNDEAALRALSRAGEIYARRHQLDAETSRPHRAGDGRTGGGGACPSWARGRGTATVASEAAPIARRALQAMLDSPAAEGLHAAAADAIAEEMAGKPHLVELILGGSFFFF